MGTEALSLHDLAEFFPGYELEGFLVTGPTRIVVRARQDALDRTVAIKLVPLEEADEGFISRVKALAKMPHPNLIGIYDSGEVDGYFFLVMEYVDGGSLAESAGTDPVAPEVAIDLLNKLCAGMSRAHESGMVHGCLTPDVILIGSDLTPKIGPGGVEGNFAYGAPEDELSERSDVYSLGRILYRLLTGGDPVELDSPAPSEIAGSPLVLDQLIQRAGDDLPEKRYASVDEFARNLTQVTKKAPTPRRVPVPTAASSRPVAGTVSAAPAKPAFKIPITELVKLGVVVLVAVVAFKIIPPLLEDTETDPEPVSHSPSTPRTPVESREKEPTVRTPVEPLVNESGSVALNRLRSDLRSGKRTEFPPGTVKGRSSHYYLVEQRLTWPKARAFAEDHGAHLAVFPTGEQREWIRRQLTSRQIAWLGGGQVFDEQWQWIDGIALGKNEVTARGEADRYLALNKQGELVPANDSQTYWFILQWRNDGSNPGTFEEELARVASAESKAFPLGTRSFGESRFFHVDRSVSWEEARKLADSMGARLAIPSSEEEHQWICATYRDQLEEGEAIWLGGYRAKKGQPWRWLSNERWNNVGWKSIAPGAEGADRLALMGSESAEMISWAMMPGQLDGKTSVLLEWRGPVKEPAVIAKQPPLDGWLKTVNTKIVRMVEPELQEFAKQKKELVQDYGRAMRRLIRREKDSPPRGRGGRFFFRTEWAEQMDELDESVKEAVKANEFVESLPGTTPKSVTEVHEEHITMLETIEETYHLKMMSHLEFYREGIGKRASALADTGYLEDAAHLGGLVPGMLEGFLKVLFPEGSPHRTLPWSPRDPEIPDGDEQDPPE